jgi:hypothetical protein
MSQPSVPCQEIQPLNNELLNFDLAAVEIEELERRFEMALALFVMPAATCDCPVLASCGTFCTRKPPV